jgi:hypothetical protein
MIIWVEKITIQGGATFDPLYKFELRRKLARALKVYIFELHGKLATAVEVTPISNSKARSFRVFELANNDTTKRYKCMWIEVMSLGDLALFLGQGCCRAVRV